MTNKKTECGLFLLNTFKICLDLFFKVFITSWGGGSLSHWFEWNLEGNWIIIKRWSVPNFKKQAWVVGSETMKWKLEPKKSTETKNSISKKQSQLHTALIRTQPVVKLSWIFFLSVLYYLIKKDSLILKHNCFICTRILVSITYRGRKGGRI